MSGLDVDIAAVATITSIRGAIGQKGFAEKGYAPVPSGTGIDFEPGFVGEGWRGVVVRGWVESRFGCGFGVSVGGGRALQPAEK